MRATTRPGRVPRSGAAQSSASALLYAALALVAGAAPTLAGTWYEDQVLETPEGPRAYRVYEPDVAPEPLRPLVLVLHGGGGDMVSILDSGAFRAWIDVADEQGVLVVAPNGTNATTGSPFGDNQHWNDCRADARLANSRADDVAFIDQLIDALAARFPVDLERVYVTGASNGGMMSYRLAGELGHRVAAIAAFIANRPAANECRGPAYPLGVMIANGDAEALYMPWEGGCIYDQGACERGSVISALATRDRYRDLLGVEEEPSEVIDHPDIAPNDGATASSARYVGGVDESELFFWRIRGGGHVTPSIDYPTSPLVLALLGLGNQCRDVEGAREAWAFLSRFTRRGPGSLDAPGQVGLVDVGKLPLEPGRLRLSWQPDCGAGTRATLYRGVLGEGLSSLEPIPGLCEVAGGEASFDARLGVSEFFLVAPRDAEREGGLGSSSAGVPRPQAAEPCAPRAAPLAACAAF